GTLRYDKLTNGDYYFVETKAPKGYQLETSHHEFTIKSTETADIETVTVSDEKTDRLPDTGERTGLLITILGILTIVFSVLIFLNKNILSNNHI
ncbi:SpaA isopeptide-forming pilin-related protein, partial [Pseudolactococcus plantarum]